MGDKLRLIIGNGEDKSKIKMAWKLCLASNFNQIEFIIMLIEIYESSYIRSLFSPVEFNMIYSKEDIHWIQIKYDEDYGDVIIDCYLHDKCKSYHKRVSNVTIYNMINLVQACRVIAYSALPGVRPGWGIVTEEHRNLSQKIVDDYSTIADVVLMAQYREAMFEHESKVIEWFEEYIKI